MRRIATAKPVADANLCRRYRQGNQSSGYRPDGRLWSDYVRRRGGRHRAGRLWEHRRGGEAIARVREETFKPLEANVRVYDQLYKEYKGLHDYLGRGENGVLKRLKTLKSGKLPE